MISLLLLVLILTSFTVIAHAVGTVYWILPAARYWDRRSRGWNGATIVFLVTRLISGLFVLHLAEMVAWAIAFYAAGVFANFETALYYSLTSYTTVGYGDVLPSTSYRLLGPIEAAVGMLMLGWSTGIIVAVMQRIYSRATDVLTKERSG